MNEAKQYLDSKGLSDTYWGKIIIEAEDRGRFTIREITLGNSWVTCACGQLTSDIPRFIKGGLLRGPKDLELENLGYGFGQTVMVSAFFASAKALHEIETRAIIVATEYQQEQIV